MNIAPKIRSALDDVIAGVKAAQAHGIQCDMPDVVSFDMAADAAGSRVYFDVPLHVGDEEAVTMHNGVFSLPVLDDDRRAFVVAEAAG